MRPETIEFTDGLPVKAFVRYVEQIPYHWHDALEVIRVQKGSVNIGLGNNNLLLRENDIAVINMGELHRFIKSQGDNEILFIQIEDCFCRSNLSDNRFFFIYCCSAYHEAEAPEKYQTLKEHINQLVRALIEKPQARCKENIENILVAMLDYLTYNFDFLRWGYGTSPFDDKRVARFKLMAEHISSNFEAQLRLKELAAEAGVSLQHLSYDIKHKFGSTFQELLYYSKCEYAAKLLLSTDRRIMDIALDCGFSDTKYLIKYFKQYYQCIPSKFREMYRADNKTLVSQTQYRDYPLSHAIGY